MLLRNGLRALLLLLFLHILFIYIYIIHDAFIIRYVLLPIYF